MTQESIGSEKMNTGPRENPLSSCNRRRRSGERLRRSSQRGRKKTRRVGTTEPRGRTDLFLFSFFFFSFRESEGGGAGGWVRRRRTETERERERENFKQVPHSAWSPVQGLIP